MVRKFSKPLYQANLVFRGCMMRLGVPLSVSRWRIQCLRVQSTILVCIDSAEAKTHVDGEIASKKDFTQMGFLCLVDLLIHSCHRHSWQQFLTKVYVCFRICSLLDAASLAKFHTLHSFNMNILDLYYLFLFLRIGEAARFFTSTTAPPGLSIGCTTALLANIACSPSVPALELGVYYPKTQLDNICTAACTTALSSYHTNILTACAADTWEGFDDEIMPVPMISELIRYHYDGTCLSDGTRFCNNVAAAFSVFTDPAAAALPGE